MKILISRSEFIEKMRNTLLKNFGMDYAESEEFGGRFIDNKKSKEIIIFLQESRNLFKEFGFVEGDLSDDIFMLNKEGFEKYNNNQISEINENDFINEIASKTTNLLFLDISRDSDFHHLFNEILASQFQHLSKDLFYKKFNN